MKIPDRLGLVVGLLAALLVGLSGVAVYSLVLLGSGLMALVVGVGGLAAVAAVVAAYAVARDVEAAVPDFAAAAEARSAATPKPQGFQLREARPGEVPAPYLDAVRKGAQATHAALKAQDRARQH